MKITIADIPVWGKFMVKELATGNILHEYTGYGHGDMPFDIADREVLAMYTKDNKMIMEVK